MLRSALVAWAACTFLVTTPAWAQVGLETTISASNELIGVQEFEQSRQVVMQALRSNPSDAEREALVDQLDKINDNIPYFISLDFSSVLTTGTRQGIWEDRLNWTGVPHYTDDTLAVEAAQAGQINSFAIGAGYTFDLTPDIDFTMGVDGEIYFYEQTDFMEAWVADIYGELDLSLGPILSNTRASYAISSKSREKEDINPNVPRVPGAYHFNIEQDLGFKFAKDQVFGTEITYRMGDETENLQFPGIQYEHVTLETYYDAIWADTLGTRFYGYGQVAQTDPTFTGFSAYGGGADMWLGLPLGFNIDGGVEYRTQAGFDPYPSRTADLDVDTIKGALEISNDHYSLRNLQPYLNAAFKETTSNYDEYTRSDMAFGAGIRFGF